MIRVAPAMDESASSSEDFGARLTRLMEQHGLIAAELARRSGVDSGNLSRLLGSKRPPGPRTVLRLCKALHVTSDYLVYGMEAAPTVGTESPMTSWERALDSFDWQSTVAALHLTDDEAMAQMDRTTEFIRNEGPKYPHRPEAVWHIRIKQLLSGSSMSGTRAAYIKK